MLLQHAIASVVLAQFGMKAFLDKNIGATQISFFRRGGAANNASGRVANVQALAEGTAISTFRNVTLSKVQVTLAQIGEAAKITDVTTYSALFDALDMNIGEMAEECTLECDNIIRDVIQVDAGLTKRYAGGLANYAALNAATNSSGKARILDFLAAVTNLKRNRAPRLKGGHFIAAIPPEVSYDLQNDPDWIGVARYNSADKIYNGEIGKMAGARFVEHTNPFIENGAGAEGTFADPGFAGSRIVTSLVFGQNAYGIPAFAGTNVPAPGTEANETDERVGVKPQVLIADKPDKSDPLNQFLTAGWKMHWNAKLLNANYLVALKSKSEFPG